MNDSESEKKEIGKEENVYIRQVRHYKNQTSAEIRIPPKHAGKFVKVIVLEGI